ncbi:MAG: hypothetical protein ACHQ4J_05555 [Candidatus Binatia bacterium]
MKQALAVTVIVLTIVVCTQTTWVKDVGRLIWLETAGVNAAECRESISFMQLQQTSILKDERKCEAGDARTREELLQKITWSLFSLSGQVKKSPCPGYALGDVLSFINAQQRWSAQQPEWPRIKELILKDAKQFDEDFAPRN